MLEMTDGSIGQLTSESVDLTNSNITAASVKLINMSRINVADQCTLTEIYTGEISIISADNICTMKTID